MSNYSDSVSGKERGKPSWVNPEKLAEQKKFMDRVEASEKGYAVEGHGQGLHGRSDLENQGVQSQGTNLALQVHEALKRGPGADVSQVRVKSLGSVVQLYGMAENAKEVRELENLALNVPGVTKVENHLAVRTGEKPIAS